MKKTAAFIVSAALFWSRSPLVIDPAGAAGIAYSGGNGETMETAIVITGGDDSATTTAEYAWLRQHVPGAKVSAQFLIHDRTRVFDRLDVNLPDGSRKPFFFDITSGFGKI